MEGQRPCSFPLLVRGDWGPAEPPPALRKKLLCYFQSQKRSGGGECELRTGIDTGTGHIIVCFACPEVKRRVLERQSHQLHLGGEGKLRLIVTEPETAPATKEKTFEEKSVPTKALDAMSSLQTKAAAIGNGTYFAVDARYSAQNIYSIPDVNGKKHMYLARVLTGQYCAGRKGLKAPPSKSPTDPTDLYDSVVDDEFNPTVFAIFNDIQAYPQYLITFNSRMILIV